MILLIDHEDSFTQNLSGALTVLGEDVGILDAKAATLAKVERFGPSAIILSSGPGTPEDWQESIEIVREFGAEIPILGVSLGQLIIAAAYGDGNSRRPQIRHGKPAMVRHKRGGLFAYLPQPLRVMCCHSAALDEGALPEVLHADAYSMDDNTVMAVRHDRHPVYGLMFHPESVGTEKGERLLAAFLEEAKAFNKQKASGLQEIPGR